MTGLALGVVLLSTLFGDTLAGIVANTTLGDTVGHMMPVYNGVESKNIFVWNNIRYAKPPIGNLRFAKPEKSDGWFGYYFATDPGPACPQTETAWIATHPGRYTIEEDCLNMNIYAPAHALDEAFPVMVWIYGGAFQNGGNGLYPGYFMATHGVVVVTINYRLGNLGFAFTGDGVIPGNIGLWDQKLALEFVRDNIRSFGGDPNKVTVFGQSAGAASTSLLAVSPLTKDLFHQAITMSGTEANMWSINSPASTPEMYTSEMATALGCPASPTTDMLTCLRGLDFEVIRDYSVTCNTGYFCLGMEPVMDGPDGLLPAWPRALRSSGNIMSGPWLTGIARDDGSLYTLAMVTDADRPGGFNRSEFMYALENDLLALIDAQLSPQQYQELLNAMDWNYSPWPYIDDGELNRLAFNELITDCAFGAPWDYLLKETSAVGTSYGYVFDFRTTDDYIFGEKIPEWMGVPHAGDVPYVWGWPMLQLNPNVRQDSGFIIDPIQWNDDDIKFSAYILEMFSNFAKFADPTPGPLGVSNPFDNGRTKWTAYDFADMTYLYAAKEPYVGKAYNQKNYVFYDYYSAYLTGFAIDGRPIDDGLLPPAPASLKQKQRRLSAQLAKAFGRFDEIRPDSSRQP